MVSTDLVGVWQQSSEVAHDGMEANVQPAADGKVGRVFPCLEAVAMAQVVGGLPVVERLVAVLDRGKHGGDQAGGEEEVEGRDGLDCVGVSDGSVERGGKVSIGSWEGN